MLRGARVGILGRGTQDRRARTCQVVVVYVIVFFDCFQVGIAKAVHTDDNKAYLANVLEAYPGSHLHKENIMVMERAVQSPFSQDL